MLITLDSTYGSMSLTSSHLRYLLTIYEVAREFPVVSSANIARKLNVSKPSVSTMLDCLMKKDLLVKERYGKVYLTDNGVLIAQELQHRIDILESELKNFSFSLTQEEIHRMAILITTEMPDVQIGESSFFKAEG